MTGDRTWHCAILFRPSVTVPMWLRLCDDTNLSFAFVSLVHPLEWRTFADQLDTLRELRDYLTVDGVLQNVRKI